jgi:large subunit ribosomal protein L25
MAKAPQLKVEKREITGRKVSQLRRQGILPANVFGKKTTSQSIQLPKSEFIKVYNEVGETGLIDLVIDGETKPRPVLVSDVTVNPVSDLILHVDFHQVDLTQKVTATVPLEATGESPAVKEKDALMLMAYSELEVEALPADLPDVIEVDLSGLVEFGDTVQAKDLKVDRTKITLLVDEEAVIASVQEPKEEEPEEVAEETPTEAETSVQGKGEESAEGEAKAE